MRNAAHQRGIDFWLGRKDPTTHLPTPGRKEWRAIEKRRRLHSRQEVAIQWAIDNGWISFSEGKALFEEMWRIIDENQAEADRILGT